MPGELACGHLVAGVSVVAALDDNDGGMRWNANQSYCKTILPLTTAQHIRCEEILMTQTGSPRIVLHLLMNFLNCSMLK